MVVACIFVDSSFKVALSSKVCFVLSLLEVLSSSIMVSWTFFKILEIADLFWLLKDH